MDWYRASAWWYRVDCAVDESIEPQMTKHHAHRPYTPRGRLTKPYKKFLLDMMQANPEWKERYA